MKNRNEYAGTLGTWDEQYRKKGFEAQRRYPNEGMIRFLAKHFFIIPKNERSKIKILEVGCGSGANLLAVAREAFSAYGIDISPRAIQLCKQMLEFYGTQCAPDGLQHADFLQLPFKSRKFDAVIDIYSSQHLKLSEHLDFYKECVRVLRPGGRLYSYCLGFKSDSFTASHRNLIEPFTVSDIIEGYPLAGNGVATFLCIDVALDLLKKSHFKEIEIEEVIRTYRNRQMKVQYYEIDALV